MQVSNFIFERVDDVMTFRTAEGSYSATLPLNSVQGLLLDEAVRLNKTEYLEAYASSLMLHLSVVPDTEFLVASHRVAMESVNRHKDIFPEQDHEKALRDAQDLEESLNDISHDKD